MTISYGSIYHEPGAIVTDNSDEEIVVEIRGDVDSSKPGQYKLVYKASDSSGNDAIPVTRIVNVINDTICCSDIIAYNETDKVTHFGLFLSDGEEVMVSDAKLEWEYWITDLSNLSVNPGAKFVLKSSFPMVKDAIFEKSITYEPNSSTLYIEVTRYYSEIAYYRYSIVTSANKPPIKKCSAIYVYNTSRTIANFELIKDGSILYVSDNARMDSSWSFELRNLYIEAGTQFLLKALCMGGDDSMAYMTLEYDPTTTETVNFLLDGNALRTVMVYNGIDK